MEAKTVLNITEKCEGNSCVIGINGELVSTTIDVAKARVKELITAGIITITFDMTNSDAIDSAGIGFIAAAHNSLSKVGGVLKLTGLSKDMYQFFICLRMNTHFIIETKDQ
jgi:serine/threonine-protein kinase RsbW